MGAIDLKKNDVLGLRVPLAVSLALIIFSGTFFVYGQLHNDESQGSLLPAVVGISVFVLIMLAFNYSALSGGSKGMRIMVALVHSVIEGAIFGFLLLFLLVNTYGS